MYSPKTEPYYLQYVCTLMLEMCNRSPDWQRELFEHPLSECRWQEYRVDASWFQRHLVMTPLFGATQMSAARDTTGGDFQTGFLQATQEYAQYTPTQSAMASSFAWGQSQLSQTQATASQVIRSLFIRYFTYLLP